MVLENETIDYLTEFFLVGQQALKKNPSITKKKDYVLEEKQ